LEKKVGQPERCGYNPRRFYIQQKLFAISNLNFGLCASLTPHPPYLTLAYSGIALSGIEKITSALKIPAFPILRLRRH
jgi:hypothetical protein